MTCTHDLCDRENAVMADGYCPLCMAAEIERLTMALNTVAWGYFENKPEENHERYLARFTNFLQDTAREAIGHQQRTKSEG